MALEQVFEYPRTLVKLRSGPLGWLLEDFCDWLLGRGFTWYTVRKHLSCVSHLNEWLGEKRWQWSGCLSREDVEGFLSAYPSRCRNRGSLDGHLKRVGHSVSRFVEFLGHRRLYDPFPDSQVYQPLLNGYLTWMREHQHASEGTLGLRCHSITTFLESLGEGATAEALTELSATRIESFFLDYARDMGHSARRSMQAALRTFLRFCFYEGYIRHGLDHAVPTLRTYKLARVPRGLGEPQAQAVLQSVNRDTGVGRRDYAILTILHTYGIRGGQARTLEFSDIRWSQDQILFRATKGGKDSLLPLTPDVGEALLDYLQNARPRSSRSEVFLTCRAPFQPLQGLSEVVRRNMRMAEVDAPCKGTNVFRHGFATRMVADGHPLKAVADVLGHRYLSTTFIYTKVDFNALSQVPLEWPEEVRS